MLPCRARYRTIRKCPLPQSHACSAKTQETITVKMSKFFMHSPARTESPVHEIPGEVTLTNSACAQQGARRAASHGFFGAENHWFPSNPWAFVNDRIARAGHEPPNLGEASPSARPSRLHQPQGISHSVPVAHQRTLLGASPPTTNTSLRPADTRIPPATTSVLGVLFL